MQARSRSIAVSVAAVICAAGGDVFALWRLRELPDFGESHSALGGAWGMLRKRASRRGRAGIVDSPIDDRARSGVLANVFGCDHVAIVDRRNARTIDTSTEIPRQLMPSIQA